MGGADQIRGLDGMVAGEQESEGRDHDAEDRRRVRHALTPEGRRVLAAADAEVERRLNEILSHRPESAAAAAFAGLAPWQEALDAHRAAPYFAEHVKNGLFTILESRTPELYSLLEA